MSLLNREPSIVALVPARSGSERLPSKNIRPLAGHPLLAYTIESALQSGIFRDVIVSTDSRLYADISLYYGASVPFLRPEGLSGSLSPDIEWIEHTLHRLKTEARAFDCFSILRPTSPFRTAETIRRAWSTFCQSGAVDSLRAVEKCRQHPGKMWVIRGRRMTPLLPFGPPEQPWHSSPYQSLPEIYIQNASLEIAWSRVVFENRTIAGEAIAPFVTEGYEGFDLNDREDWELVKRWVDRGEARLPAISRSPYPSKEVSESW